MCDTDTPDTDVDPGSLAEDIAAILETTEFVKMQGWEVRGLDIGEIEITLPTGQLARLTVELIDRPPADE